MGPLTFLIQFFVAVAWTVAAQRPNDSDPSAEKHRSSMPPVAVLPFAVGIIFCGLVICTQCWSRIRRANKPLPTVPREYWRLPPVPRQYWRLPALPREYSDLPPLPPDEESSTGLVPPYESVPRRAERSSEHPPPQSPVVYFEPPPYHDDA
ncbi:hypothetical protein MSAN_01586500 [Mycena sanguinolenta]|uniref:Transmembrane protein n=1 Tax=Mycena sanguinolenta TaxID=230812 RepID=A0A8H6Y3J9_9AGAR|nr:hypothetical protein MSAN_01586500 [Mycena sanguinolenta]